jgi:type I restriction-modification system DNA methylase subunit
MTRQAGKEALQILIGDFGKNESQFMSRDFQETEACTRFIDPFFSALGWEVNQTCLQKKYWDVHREYSQRDNSVNKKPDYAFRVIEGAKYREKFFVEAKAPHVDLKGNIPVFQAKRYAFSSHGKTPIVILTDFQTFRVFNGLEKPVFENPLQGLLKGYDLEYHEYLEKWDALWDTFSKEAVAKGSIEQLIGKVSRNVKSLDDEFLADISAWREILARNVALRNKDLSVDQINEAVQRVLDRLIFIRNLEDRGIESEEGLLFFTNANEEIYLHLIPLFRRLDNEYNGQIFKEHFSENISIDDPTIKAIIKQLYPPKSPYAFDIIEPEILGRIYERFLGSKIRLTKSHQAKVEEKPEVRHAGGVYYTPEYIVDYIVENTVGVKIQGKSPEEITAIKICDPACGSGSFLLGAFQYLIEYHREWYAKADAAEQEKYKNDFYTNAENDIQLTHKKKTEILKNNIFGVDIDREAVEVAIMSLYLKLLDEGQAEMFLPDITDNIKCGNSLIGTDFYVQSGLDLSPEERKKVNCFDWEKEFKEVGNREREAGKEADANSAGLFDVVIGNPPYSYLFPKMMQDYFQKAYKHQDYQKDLYLIFLEKYSSLLKDNGIFGVIVSNTWILSLTYKKIRMYLTSNYSWRKILHLPEKVFDAVVDTHVLVFEKAKPDDTDNCIIEICRNKEISPFHILPFYDIPKDGSPVNVTVNPRKRPIFQRIVKECRQLKDYCNVYNGVKPFEKGKGTPPQSERIIREKPYVAEGAKPGSEWSPLLRGSLIHRYINRWNNDYWIKYGKWLAAPRDPSVFEASEKLVIRQTGDSLIATYIESSVICRNNLHVILSNSDLSILAMLAIINSKLLNFIYEIMNPEKGEALAEVKKSHVEQLPIPALDLSQKPDKAKHDALVSLVDKMLDLKQEEATEKSEHLKTLITRQIDVVDKAIDTAVYELYNLTADEIKVVEGME